MPPVLLGASALALVWVLLPFYGTILWAIAIALLFTPLYRWMLPRLKGGRNLSAGLVLMVVLLLGVLPFALITSSLAQEASFVYQRIESGQWNPALYLRDMFDALPHWTKALLTRGGVADFDVLQRQVTTALAQASRALATQAIGIGLDTFTFIASLGITLYLSFFLVRDGEQLAQVIKAGLPVPAHCKAELIERFLAVVRATVRGGLLIAAIQGMLGGFAFWFLDIQGALLWAVVMALLSLLPLLGAGLVWVPVAGYLFVDGELWHCLGLIAYGVLVIGLADNLLRPVLVGKSAGLPDYVVMITTIGGIAVFGINGFIIGPTIAAMFFAVWHWSVQARELPP